MRGSRHVFFQARYLQPTLAHLRLAHLPPTVVKRWAHINETEFKTLGRMRKLGYASKDIQAVLGRSKSWVTKNTKRLGKTFTKKFVKCRPGPKNQQQLLLVSWPGQAGPGGALQTTDLRHRLSNGAHRMHGAQARAQFCSENVENTYEFHRLS